MGAPGKGIAGARLGLASLRAIAAVIAPLIGLGCASAPPASPSAAARLDAAASPAPPPSPDAIVVRLAFAAEVDLDLYVTGPLGETVYFANTPARTGGRLLADARCEGRTAEPTRLETVIFDPAQPGRYRVGIDFPERCDGGKGPAAFALSVEGAGAGPLRRESTIALRAFDAVVLEFDR